MAQTRDIQRRIRSIGNTKKITHAMEMVSASKMRKAIEAVLKTRSYAGLSWNIVLNLSKAALSRGDTHPLLAKRPEIKKVAVVLITSNRGLCGGFNTALFNKIIEAEKRGVKKDSEQKIEYDFIVMGKKGEAIYRRYGYNMSAQFPKMDLAEGVGEIIPVAKMAINDFLSGKYDKVVLAYNDFMGASRQIPRLKQILPVETGSVEDFLGFIGDKGKNDEQKEEPVEYLFEPDPVSVLDDLLPRVIETQLFQAILESNASEHSSRMAAMRQATDAAGDLMSELTLYYNKARQAGITSEIAEISAGANALGK
jgi:F-type H+-transporting ATPase subunit gamma